jgi:hypothetical protein
VKLRIAFGFGNLLAKLGDFRRGDPETAADFLEPFAGGRAKTMPKSASKQ